jgi:hypothetical protein
VADLPYQSTPSGDTPLSSGLVRAASDEVVYAPSGDPNRTHPGPGTAPREDPAPGLSDPSQAPLVNAPGPSPSSTPPSTPVVRVPLDGLASPVGPPVASPAAASGASQGVVEARRPAGLGGYLSQSMSHTRSASQHAVNASLALRLFWRSLLRPEYALRWVLVAVGAVVLLVLIGICAQVWLIVFLAWHALVG